MINVTIANQSVFIGDNELKVSNILLFEPCEQIQNTISKEKFLIVGNCNVENEGFGTIFHHIVQNLNGSFFLLTDEGMKVNFRTIEQ